MSNSRSLFVAFDVLRDHLATVIREGHARPQTVGSLLFALGILDLSKVANLQEACALWLRQILDSGYPEGMQYSMASSVVVFFGKKLDSPLSERHIRVHSTALRPLSDFLLLSEKLYPAECPLNGPPYPGVMALRMLSIGVGGRHADPMLRPTLTPAILQTLASALLPTHPLRSRRLALQLFQGTGTGWFSTQAEAFSNAERAELLGAVGDPFRFTPDPPLQDGQPQATTFYEPIGSAALLVEFAGSESWRVHLFPSNFASCEEVLSTEKGRDRFFREASGRGTSLRMRSVDKLASALRRLEEMECWNTAEVVVMWAWTDGFVDATDHDAWRIIGHETLKFYRIRGMDRLGSLSRYIKRHFAYGSMVSRNTSCQVAGVRRPVHLRVGREGASGGSGVGMRGIYRVCQLRRLCQLFGLDPTAWRETMAAGKSDKKLSGGSNLEGEGEPMPHVQFLYSACDYP